MHDTIYPMLASSLGGLHNNPDRELPERTGNRHSGMAVAPYNIYDDERRLAGDHLHVRAALARRGDRTGPARADRRPQVPHAKDRVANIDAVDEEVSSLHQDPDARRAGPGPAGRRGALCAGQVDP